jgi:hypothetical protein
MEKFLEEEEEEEERVLTKQLASVLRLFSKAINRKVPEKRRAVRLADVRWVDGCLLFCGCARLIPNDDGVTNFRERFRLLFFVKPVEGDDCEPEYVVKRNLEWSNEIWSSQTKSASDSRTIALQTHSRRILPMAEGDPRLFSPLFAK